MTCSPLNDEASDPDAAEVTVLIPTWNSGQFLGRCLASLERQTRRFELLIVDNGSTDGSLDDLEQHRLRPRVVRLGGNRGFAGAVSRGWALCRTSWVALLNVDTEAEPRWLDELLRVGEDPSLGVTFVASKMLSLQEPETIDDAGDSLSWYGSAKKRGHGEPASLYSEDTEVFSACAGAALYRRDAVHAVGGFDPRFESYFEDIDVGLRLRLAGHRCWYASRARVLHYGGGSALSRQRYVRLVTRNRLLTFAKTLPVSVLFRHSPRLLWGQLYFLVAYRHPWQSVLGLVGLLLAVPHLARERRAFARCRRLAATEIDELLTDELGEPRLRELLRRKLRSSATSRGIAGGDQ